MFHLFFSFVFSNHCQVVCKGSFCSGFYVPRLFTSSFIAFHCSAFRLLFFLLIFFFSLFLLRFISCVYFCLRFKNWKKIHSLFDFNFFFFIYLIFFLFFSFQIMLSIRAIFYFILPAIYFLLFYPQRLLFLCRHLSLNFIFFHCLLLCFVFPQFSTIFISL